MGGLCSSSSGLTNKLCNTSIFLDLSSIESRRIEPYSPCSFKNSTETRQLCGISGDARVELIEFFISSCEKYSTFESMESSSW